MKRLSHRAFTLIELLVVIAVIGVLAASIGMALRDGDRGPALQAAQSSLSSLVGAARAQAALDGVNSTVLIWSDDSDVETYLRRACVAQFRDTNADGTADAWVVQGDLIDLPRGVFFVPGDLGANFPAKWSNATDWSGLTTTKSQVAGNAPSTSLTFKREDATGAWVADPAGPSKAYVTIAFDTYGNLVSKQGANQVDQLAVGTGEIQPLQGVLFNSADSLRGLKLSIYGMPMVLNEKTAFE